MRLRSSTCRMQMCFHLVNEVLYWMRKKLGGEKQKHIHQEPHFVTLLDFNLPQLDIYDAICPVRQSGSQDSLIKRLRNSPEK